MSKAPKKLELPKRHLVIRIAGGFLLVLIFAILVYFFFAARGARERSRLEWCNSMFARIGMAMRSYHEAHNSFPPAYLADPQGKPMHSWRVILSPLLDERTANPPYKFDEPWNGPHNQALAQSPPGLADSPEYGENLYLCPSDRGAGRYDTSRVLLVGPGTAFDGPYTANLRDITDGPAQTVIAGEMSSSGIHWMEPRDLDVKKMSFKINDRKLPALRSNHPGGANVLFADGSSRFLTDDTAPDVVKALTTIAGGESFKLGP